MSIPRKTTVPESPSYFDQLESMLRNGDSRGTGYAFDRYTITEIGRDIDRLRFSPYGMILVELRQATNQTKDTARSFAERRDKMRAPLQNMVIVDLLTMHPSLSFGMQHEDLYRCSTIKSSWRFADDGEIKFNMVEPHTNEHGEFTLKTRMAQLELVLGKLPVAEAIPEHYFLDL